MESIKRTKIAEVLKRTDFGTLVNVKGWVRTRRGNKQVGFIALNDGSTINNVQIVVDLTKFDIYKEVVGRSSDGILVPSVVGDGLYSLPETMNFYVLFCRTDILDKLGLEAPDTLDGLISMLPDLQMRGLNVFYPSASMSGMRNFHATTPIVYQNGGILYGETALELQLDSEKTVYGFTELTELFTLYDMPVDVPNFYQHFRNGDLAMGIADFNSYNLILNAAPEIANSWSIAPVPGVFDASEAKVNRFMSGGAESTVMFTSNDERERDAWRFMDWWSSTDVQAEFGQMIQIMYGDEYIWPTANSEAFGLLPYPNSDQNIILDQAAEIRDGQLRVNLRSGESRMLATSPTPVQQGSMERGSAYERSETLPLTGEREEGLWRLSFIDSTPTITQTFSLDTLCTWENLNAQTAELMGTGVYECTFKLNTEEQAKLRWQLDLGDVRESARVSINGVTVGCAWAVPYVLNIPSGVLRKGENQLRIEVTNLPANRIAALDRQNVPWRKFEDINVVDINYRPTNYAHWAPMPSGLKGPVRLRSRQ